MCMYRPDTTDEELNKSLYGWGTETEIRYKSLGSWGTETEIRFVVDEFDRSILNDCASSLRIEQGYLPSAPHITLRVRIINQDLAVLTKKVGFGLMRSELEVERVDPKMARAIYRELCVYRVEKTRYKLAGGWTLDIYDRPVGLVVAEYEGKDAVDQRKHLPAWMKRATEITETATNADIARWTHEQEVGLLRCSVREMLVPIKYIVLAGGPGSGKSTMFKGLQGYFRQHATFVVEAARMLIDHAGQQPPVGDEIAMNRFERGIYEAHKLLMGMAEDEARRIGAKAFISDRHQIDIMVYLNSDQSRFEQVCDTRLDYEYTKGDLVFYCAMPDRETYERLCMGDGVRWENYDQAMEIDQRLRAAYAGFGDRVIEIPFDASKSKEDRLWEPFWRIRSFLGL